MEEQEPKKPLVEILEWLLVPGALDFSNNQVAMGTETDTPRSGSPTPSISSSEPEPAAPKSWWATFCDWITGLVTLEDPESDSESEESSEDNDWEPVELPDDPGESSEDTEEEASENEWSMGEEPEESQSDDELEDEESDNEDESEEDEFEEVVPMVEEPEESIPDDPAPSLPVPRAPVPVTRLVTPRYYPVAPAPHPPQKLELKRRFFNYISASPEEKTEIMLNRPAKTPLIFITVTSKFANIIVRHGDFSDSLLLQYDAVEHEHPLFFWQYEDIGDVQCQLAKETSTRYKIRSSSMKSDFMKIVELLKKLFGASIILVEWLFFESNPGNIGRSSIGGTMVLSRAKLDHLLEYYQRKYFSMYNSLNDPHNHLLAKRSFWFKYHNVYSSLEEVITFLKAWLENDGWNNEVTLWVGPGLLENHAILFEEMTIVTGAGGGPHPGRQESRHFLERFCDFPPDNVRDVQRDDGTMATVGIRNHSSCHTARFDSLVMIPWRAF